MHRRLQLSLSPEVHKQLQDFQKRSRNKSNVDTVQDALRVFEWFLEQKEKGRALLVRDGEKSIEVHFCLGG